MPRDGGRNAQVRRLLDMVGLLSRSSGLTLAQLAEHYGATQRTIRRDLDALREAGQPLVSDSVAGNSEKLWRVATGKHAQQLGALLDTSHYLALRLAMGQGGPVRNQPTMFETLEDLHHRIEKALGARGREQLLAIDRAFLSYEKHAYREAPDVLWLLVQAIVDHRVCSVTYRAARSGGREKTYQVLPLRIFVHDGTVHALCHVSKYNQYVPLNLHRLTQVKLLDERRDEPADFDSDHFERAAFGVHFDGEPTRFVLEFDKEAAIYIRERTWHPTQALVELPAGRVKLTFTCGMSWEVSAWVASWRQWVHVVEPKSLQLELRELGKRLARRYAALEKTARTR